MTARRDSLGNPYRDLPQLLPLLQPLARRTHLLEREYAIHHRSQLPRAQHPHDLAVFRLVSHGRAQDTPLVPDEPPQVDGHVRAGVGAATHEPAAAHVGRVAGLGMMATFCSGTTTYSHSVPGRCSPSSR